LFSGKYFDPDGSRFEGEYKDGLRNGFGNSILGLKKMKINIVSSSLLRQVIRCRWQ